MVFRPNRRRSIKQLKSIGRSIGGFRVTIRKRLQQRRTGQLHGSVRGATSRVRARLTAVKARFRRRR